MLHSLFSITFRWILCYPFYRWETWSSESLNNLPKITLAVDWALDDILTIWEDCYKTSRKGTRIADTFISVSLHDLLNMTTAVILRQLWSQIKGTRSKSEEAVKNDRKDPGLWWCHWTVELINPWTSELCFSYFEIRLVLLVAPHNLSKATYILPTHRWRK